MARYRKYIPISKIFYECNLRGLFTIVTRSRVRKGSETGAWRKKMRLFLLSLAVSAAVTGPVFAQSPVGGYQNRGDSYRDSDEGRRSMSAQIEQMRDRIETGVQSGAINRQEAMPLRSGLRSLTQLERRYSRNGLNDQETRDLQMRLRSLRQDVRRADEGASGRYDEWDRHDGRDDDRYGDREDYGYGRDERRDDGERYRQPGQRVGVGGVIDNVPGRNAATLDVGQRAPSGLYGVPYDMRERYRDTDRFYYRSDGRQIYQIDARSQTVIRVHTMNR